MRYRFALVGVCFLLLSCSAPVASPPAETDAATPAAPPVAAPSGSDADAPSDAPSDAVNRFQPFDLSSAQLLPVTAQANLAGTVVQLEVAETRQQQALGLMYRTELADDRGMLFPFDFPRRASFWMKNVPISLDMIFLLEGRVQAIASNVPPCAAEPCPTYGPGAQLVDQVIELRGGRAAEIGLEPGDVVEIEYLE